MENKKVLVTGGNRGIGKGIVEGFLNNGNEVLASFVNNSSDMAAIGYPYGFVDADRFAQVRKNELPMYKGMLIAQIGNHPEYKKFHSLASSTKFHDELNKVTS